MSSRIFLDSSILIEYRKGTRVALLDQLIQHSNTLDLCVSEVVSSEYLFHLLALFGQKSPLTLKENKTIEQYLDQANPNKIINQFSWLAGDATLHRQAVEIMSAYNLLSNDALILSLCQLHQIRVLASYDTDFIIPCDNLGITLLQKEEDFWNWWQ